MNRLLVILTIILTKSAFSQTVRFVGTYQKERGSFKTTTIPMPYDSDSILRSNAPAISGQILRIDYVATSYTSSLTSYQKKLDKTRWETLSNFTGIDFAQVTECNIIYQTSAQTEEEAKKLFHGFVIYYTEAQTAWYEKSINSLSGLMEVLAESDPSELPTNFKLPGAKVIKSDSVGTIDLKKKTQLTNSLQTDNQLVIWTYDSIGIDKKYYQARYTIRKVSAGIFAAYKLLTDLSIFETLNRVRFTKKTLIVTDLTCSMYPYYSQLVVWHSILLNGEKPEHYVFFNDGDGIANEEKIIGSTGGLYPTKTTSLLNLFKTMELCMSKGCSGDIPENNFEAILHGIEKYDSIEKVVILCDNFAIPRDTSLLNEIQVPVEFVMCGASLGINPVYLNLAKRCKGSIHTMEKSINRLDLMQNGTQFNIGNRRYKVKRGLIEELLSI